MLTEEEMLFEDAYVLDYLEEKDFSGTNRQLQVTNKKNRSIMLYSELRMIIFIVLPAMILFCSLCLLALDWKQLWNDSLLDSLYSSHELESRSMLRKYQFYHHKSLKSNHAFNAIREPQQQRKQKGSIYRGFDADTIFEKRERRPVLSGLRIPKICERQKMTTV